MKNLNCFCTVVAAVLVFSCNVWAQERGANTQKDHSIIVAPDVTDTQPSVSDQSAPPTPQAVATPVSQSVVGSSDCLGCGQTLSLVQSGRGQVGCGQVVPCGQTVTNIGGCHGCQPCGCGPTVNSYPVAPVAFADSGCGDCGQIGLVVYQEAAPREVPIVSPADATFIVAPGAFNGTNIDGSVGSVITDGILTDVPTNDSAPMYGQVPAYNPAPAVPVTSGCAGCGAAATNTNYSTPMMSAPFINRGGYSVVPRSVGRVRGVVGGRILRRN